jgi:hypothetical protein
MTTAIGARDLVSRHRHGHDPEDGRCDMISLLIGAVSASLLDSGGSWNPAGRRGKTAQPDYLAIAGAAAAVPIPDLPSMVIDRAEIGLRKMRAAYNSAPDYAKIAGSMANPSDYLNKIAQAANRINEVPAVLPSVMGSVAQAAAEPLKAAAEPLKAAAEPLKADLQAAVAQKAQEAEVGLRRMQAAYNSAPDYAKVAGGLLSSELASRMNEVPAVLPNVMESGLRKMREAYASAPDYRNFVDTVLGAAAGVAGQDDGQTGASDSFDCFGFPIDLNPCKEAFRQLPYWHGAAEAATPDYGNIAMTTALIGHADDADTGSSLW